MKIVKQRIVGYFTRYDGKEATVRQNIWDTKPTNYTVDWYDDNGLVWQELRDRCPHIERYYTPETADK